MAIIWDPSTDIGFGAQIANNQVIGTSDFFAIGRNPDLDRNRTSFMTPNDGVHVPIENPTKIYVSVDDIGDIGKAVLVTGLDTDYREKSQVVPITAQSVDIGDWGAILGMQVVGPNAVIGNVYASTITNPVTGGEEVQSIILPADQIAYNAYYLVPRGRIAYAYEFIFTDYRDSGGANANTEFYLETRKKDSGDGQATPWQRRAYVGLQISGSSGLLLDLKTPFRIPEMTELRVAAESSANNLSASLVLQFIVRDV